MMKDFDFHFPIEELKKSQTSEGDWIIRGVASAPNKDIQGEFLDPNGMDTGNLKYFNYDHKQDPKYIVGEITKHWIDDLNRFWVEGIIYKTSEIGQQIVALAKTLAKESKKMFKLGFSVEGSILERDLMNKSHITKSVVNSIAIAPFPVNATTWAEILTKGISSRNPIYEMENKKVYSSCRMENGQWVCIDKDMLIKSCYKSKEDSLKLYKQGLALPEGKYPIEDFEDLAKAIELYKLSGDKEIRPIRWFRKRLKDLAKAIEAGSTTGTQTLNTISHGPSLKGEDVEKDIKYQDSSGIKLFEKYSKLIKSILEDWE